ncbi:MAG: hypothetical protein HYU51_18690 [Candidatus Rokubacteria bacterium]|nr:hypothetical protein [Candidatus Rokubacteria bacterium]
MRWVIVAALAIGCLGAVVGADAQVRGRDLRIAARGSETTGDAMKLDCDLDFVSVPSNLFAGVCRLTLGADEVLLNGTDYDRRSMPAVTLNGLLTITAVAASATGRFATIAPDFPVSIELDPLRREWRLRAGVPGGAAETVSSGALTGGRMLFALP